MKRIITTVLALTALSTLEAFANKLDSLFPAVRVKVEKYCPATLTAEQLDTLRQEEVVTIEDVEFYAENAKKTPTLTENETLILCSGQYSQNRSNPGRVDCSFCKEGKTNTPLLSLNVRITRDVDETLANRETEKENEQPIELSETEESEPTSENIQS